jgi:ribosomal protein S18 acetylase RimI-like enzyme
MMSLEVILRRLSPHERDAAWEVAHEFGVAEWSREEFHRRCEAGLIGGILAECGTRVPGLLLYALHPQEGAVTVLIVEVSPDLRRRGIGSALLADLRYRLQAAGAVRIDALVNERDLAAQLFLRASGFRAARVLPAAFAGGADDGYCFECRLPPARAAPRARPPRRRDPSIE